MKTITIIIAILTVVLLLSTLLCGFWIKSKGLGNDAEAIAFHIKIGAVSVIFGLVSAVLLFVKTIHQ